MKKSIIIPAALFAFVAFTSCRQACAVEDGVPDWFETDSVAAIAARTAADFSLGRSELLELLRSNDPDITDADIDTFLLKHYLEAKDIAGEQRFHRKSARNLRLLNPAMNGGFEHRGANASDARISYVDSVLNFYKGSNTRGLSHLVNYKFTVDVPYCDAIAGDTLRVWLPLPLTADRCSRQRDVAILSSYPESYVLSGPRSVHNTIYFEAPSPAPGDTAHFEYTASFVTSGMYVSGDDIKTKILPYDTAGIVYKQYTRLPDGKHIVRLDSLAHAIVGAETNPFVQSEKVFDYIIDRYPWAGAREYSTISCIPEYVVREGHGDCGQVSLLYISLMRSLGVPARWESGWMLHPGEVNLHDWAEVYFEGLGWLPVDVSFGRYTGAGNDAIAGFYSHGIDSHRFATNKGVGGVLYPAKKFVRSETVDFQLGEVETLHGNLYYPAWDSSLELISVEPIEENK